MIRLLYERGYDRPQIINLLHFIDWVMALPPTLDEAFWQEVEQYEGEKKNAVHDKLGTPGHG